MGADARHPPRPSCASEHREGCWTLGAQEKPRQSAVGRPLANTASLAPLRNRTAARPTLDTAALGGPQAAGAFPPVGARGEPDTQRAAALARFARTLPAALSSTRRPPAACHHLYPATQRLTHKGAWSSELRLIRRSCSRSSRRSPTRSALRSCGGKSPSKVASEQCEIARATTAGTYA